MSEQSPAVADKVISRISIRLALQLVFVAISIFFGSSLFTRLIEYHKPYDPTIAIDRLPVKVLDKPSDVIFDNRPKSLKEGVWAKPIPRQIAPMWAPDSLLDLIVVVSRSSLREPLSITPPERIVVDVKGFGWGNPDERRRIDATFRIPEDAHCTKIWGHFYIGLTGAVLDPTMAGYDSARAFSFGRVLTQNIPENKVEDMKQFGREHLTSNSHPQHAVSGRHSTNAFYHPNFIMSFIPDAGTMSYLNLNRAVRQHVHLEPTGARDESGQNGWYYPVLFINTFWQLKVDMVELNNSVTTLPIHVELNAQKSWLFQVLANVDGTTKQNIINSPFAEQETHEYHDGFELDIFKEIWLETNVYLLVVLASVFGVYVFLEVCGLFSDIKQAQNRMQTADAFGLMLSRKAFVQGVTFLYLLDSVDYSSRTLLAARGIGMIFEFSKLLQSVRPKLRTLSLSIFTSRAAFGRYMQRLLTTPAKHQTSGSEHITEHFEAWTFKIMSISTIASLSIYVFYGFFFGSRSSAYSIIVTTLAGIVQLHELSMAVYPLYTNHCLKSIPFMPTRSILYRLLHAIIDNLVAITFNRHTLHSLTTLRDDILLLIHLCQSLHYEVDHNRPNEFGQTGLSDDAQENFVDALSGVNQTAEGTT